MKYPRAHREAQVMTEPTNSIEQRAIKLWREKFKREPTEPLETKGGALDPRGECMKQARREHGLQEA